MSNAVADLFARLRLDISDFSSKLASASKEMGAFATNLNKNYGKANAALRSHNITLRDVTRIVQGIMVSQVFYQGARSIREATRSLMEFNEQLDYAKVTYSALFGDTQLANDFVRVLQEHSVETIFEYSDLAEASKKLLAYGIEYKNLMFIMEGLTNLGAMSGDTAAMDRIALALGQIQTTGYLAATEMRQLANAYVPIYDIVKESFGLTGDQMKSVGDLKLPAHEVINAIVDYANGKFGSVGDAAMYTITGLKNRVVDTMKVLGSEMTKPLTIAWKSFLAYVSKGLDSIRDTYSRRGWGGLFETLVPDPQMQTTIRQFIANVRNTLMSLASVGVILGQVFGNFAYVLMNAFNIVSPVIVAFTNSMSSALNAMLSTRAGAVALRLALLAAAGAFVVLKIQSIGALAITAVTKAVVNLSKALLMLAAIVTKHPILALLAGLTIAILGVSVASNSANSAISGLFDTLSGAAGGMSSADVLQGVENTLTDSADAAGQFNNRLEDGADAADDLADGIDGAGDAAKKAAKKAAGLLSFDEVFRLNEPTNSASGAGSTPSYNGLAGDLAGLIDGFGGLSDALIPDIPDFSEYINGFTDGLFGGLKDSFLARLSALGLGTLLSSRLLKSLESMKVADALKPVQAFATKLMTAILGAFVGLTFDHIVGTVTSEIFAAIAEGFNLSDNSANHAKLGATIGSTIGGAIGFVFGGLKGSPIGSSIGHLAGGIVGLTWEEIGAAFSNTIVGAAAGIAGAIAKAFGASIKNIAGMINFSSFSGFFDDIASIFTQAGLKSVAKGGIIGMAIGFLTDAVAALLWSKLAETFKLSGEAEGNAKVGQTIGSVIGVIVGGILGGPPGALIGSAIGTFAGGFVGLFWEKIAEYFDPENNVFTAFIVDTAAGLAEWWDSTKSGFSLWASDTWDGLSTWFKDSISGFKEWFDSTFDGLSDWWDDTVETFSDWDDINGETLSTWFENTKAGLSSWFDSTSATYENWRVTNTNKISQWYADTSTKFETWKAATILKFALWANDVINKIETWKATMILKISMWAADSLSAVAKWITDTTNAIRNWSSDVVAKFNTFKADALAVFLGFNLAVANAIANWAAQTLAKFTTWGRDVLTSIRTNIDGAKSKISEFLNIDFSSALSRTLSNVRSWASNILSTVRSYFSDAIEWVQDFLDLDSKASSRSTAYSTSNSTTRLGHATGGIFDREHIARFAEGNKAEAIIPLENASAMQPFVDAVSNGIIGSLAPVLAQGTGTARGASESSNLPPLYVGTLIADDRGLKQLYKKFELISVQENARRGLPAR